MTLLRKVRHLELRVFRLQEFVAMGRIILEYIQGSLNPSDSLTKDSDQHHMDLLLECLGLEEDSQQSSAAKSFVEHALEGFGVLSGQNKRRVIHALERGWSYLGFGNAENSAVENLGTGHCPEVREVPGSQYVGVLPQEPLHVFCMFTRA